MTEPLKASQGSLYIQKTPGKAPEYLSCADLGDISDPQGGQTLLRCRDGNGDFQTVGATVDAPDAVSLTVTAWLFPNADILDDLKRCNANLFALQSNCGKRGQFNQWQRAAIVHHARLVNRTLTNVVMREAGDATTRALEFSAWNPVYNLRTVKVKRQTIAETTALNAIALCNTAQCAGDCGESRDAALDAFLGGNAPSGSPTDRADIWQTEDGGLTWANLTGGAAHPFVAGQDIKSVACFDLDRSTVRRIAARESVGGEALKIAYSDDNGATWTLVTIGSTNGEGAAGGKALFARDRNHVWLVTTEGNVWFSADGGLTWEDSASALDASNGNSLNAVSFIDDDNGYVVGDSDTIIKTEDAGETWEAVTAPTSGANITALHTFSPFRVIIGTNTDKLYQTWDAGENWEAKTFTGQSTAGTITALQFTNDLTGFMAHNTVAPVGSVHRTIDGGHTWEKLSTPTNAGLNDLAVYDENLAFAVGNAQGGTGVVLKIS